MNDEQQGGMEPDEAASSRHFIGGAVPEPEPTDDTEGHAVRGRPAKDDEELGSETGTEASDGDDTEAHGRWASDRDLKRDITPVSW
jgi:hypothetical protein